MASSSPRRSFLLQEINIPHTTLNIDFNEDIKGNIESNEVALHIAKLKATQLPEILDNEIYITSDTVVVLGDLIIGKPHSREKAIETLSLLSGQKHDVTTGVCLNSKEKQICFKSTSSVYFKEISLEEITYYVDNFKPFDKAGAYGIQEWIGLIGIEKIEGSFYNIMGLPTDLIYKELQKF